MNIYELIRGRRHYVVEERLRSFMYQLLKAMDHMHRSAAQPGGRQQGGPAPRAAAFLGMHAKLSARAVGTNMRVPTVHMLVRTRRQERHLPPRHQAGEHPADGRRAEAGRLWQLPRRLLKAALHRVHQHALVQVGRGGGNASMERCSRTRRELAGGWGAAASGPALRALLS